MTKDFASVEQEAYISIQRTAWMLKEQMSSVLKPHDLSTHQYNVLRILRGAGSDGLKCSDIAERMVTRDSDITRLIDRLEKTELTRRERCPVDRRVIHVYITPEGKKLLKKIDQPLMKKGEELFVGLKKSESQLLVELLAKLRD